MDRERIEELMEILKQSSAAEICCQEGDSFIRIRRESGEGQMEAETAAGPVLQEAMSQTELSGDEVETVSVKARLVGTFHLNQEGEEQPAVECGAQVAEGQVIGTVEALGKWTDVVSPVGGQVIEIVGEDNSPVQYGDVLIRVGPSQGGQADE